MKESCTWSSSRAVMFPNSGGMLDASMLLDKTRPRRCVLEASQFTRYGSGELCIEANEVALVS